MNIEVNLKPEDVNRFVADAILKSALGQELEKAIRECVGRLSIGYDSVLKRVVEKQVAEVVMVLIREEYGEQLRQQVRAQITEAALLQITTAAVKAVIDKTE